MYKNIFTYLFLSLYLASALFAQSNISPTKNNKKVVQKAYISLLSPYDNQMTSREKVLFKGVTKGLDSLKIGKRKVIISKNGSFYHRHYLPAKNAYNKVDIVGTKLNGEKVVKSLRIFRVHKEFESDRLDAALDSIHAAYQSIGWKQKPFIYSARRYLSDQVIESMKRSGTLNEENVLEEEPQIEIMMEYAELLRKDNTALLLIPWTGSALYLEEITNHIVRSVDQMSLMTLRNFGVLWFNRELSILENYSSRSAVDEPLSFVKWILNDKHTIKLGSILQDYKQFVSERFFVDYRKITHQKMRHSKKKVMNNIERLRSYHESPEYKEALSYQGKGYYYIMTGTFAKYDNAKFLREDMRTEGYNSDVVPFEQKDGMILYRVQLGPFQDKTAAKEVDKSLTSLGFETLLLKI